jgi:hypothetical protein
VERLDYSPITERPRLSWPGAARVAIWVVPNVEHYEYLPARIRVRDPWPRQPHPDVLNYGRGRARAAFHRRRHGLDRSRAATSLFRSRRRSWTPGPPIASPFTM